MQRNHNHTKICIVEKVIDETPTVRTLIFSDDVMSAVLPGQFAMVWIPGINELPMSVMISQESGKAAFTVRRHGSASTGLFNIQVGQQIGVRGPYGNSFDLKQGKLLLVGGGTGLVPMMRLLTFVKPSDDVTILIGAKSKNEVFFEGLANALLK
ncbi:MAG: dihydroorotate dehydrogenase electron transfer subunit, partial [Nitrosarchaeum sp.]|nr:dihydroorotate dehydrogenase electron transfer subunit [Nitrosarchaeum sp.]